MHLSSQVSPDIGLRPQAFQSLTAGWTGVDSVFKMQTRPVNFPLITLHSSVKGGALHIPFHLCSASETETGVGFERRDKGCSQGGEEEGEGETARLKSHFFAPRGVSCCCCCSLFLPLSED